MKQYWSPLLLLLLVVPACGSGTAGKGDRTDPTTDTHAPTTDIDDPTDDGDSADDHEDTAIEEDTWTRDIQPLLVESCGSCHLGDRFSFASLSRAGDHFTEAETAQNYETFLDMVNLDSPESSRILAKILPEDDPRRMPHAGGPIGFDSAHGDDADSGSGDDSASGDAAAEDDSGASDDPAVLDGQAIHDTLLAWIEEEKAARCPDCGMTATTAYLAYVDQPEIFWAIGRIPERTDRWMRMGARVMMQPLDPETGTPAGDPFPFLPESFCGPEGACDFGHLSVSHAGDRLVFECRLDLSDDDAIYDVSEWVYEVRWNICVAEIGPDGRAEDPRFLMPEELRHSGYNVARSSPFGLSDDDGWPIKGVWDKHYRVRPRIDQHPVFTPDDSRVTFSSMGTDPRTGELGTTTYHGFSYINNIISVRVGQNASGESVDGTERLTVYRNEGGEADFPGYRRNGNVAFHTWNLERMDSHIYTQAHADGMIELPVLFGRGQGPNQWGKWTELGNGALAMVTGMRLGESNRFTASIGDHTMGTGLDTSSESFRLMDPALMEELGAWPDSFCEDPPDGINCQGSHFTEDISYFPDGRALVSHNPESTFYAQGETMVNRYGVWPDGIWGEERLELLYEGLAAHVPKAMGIYLMDHRGELTLLHGNEEGRAYRYPVWVGKRQAPRVQPVVTDESEDSFELHIADFRVWLTFRNYNSYHGLDKVGAQVNLDTITKVRVMTKVMGANACLSDAIPYTYAVNSGSYDHPTHLGISNGSGYERLTIPESAGGDGFGDVPLHADGSVRLRLPAGQLLLFQGVDDDGHVRRQRARVFAMPPGHIVDTSVKREHYSAECGACHGQIDADEPLLLLPDIDEHPPRPMDFDTLAAANPIVDLTGPDVVPQKMTHLHAIRPILDASCVSCHSGESPAGELSLQAEYSETGNYPAGSWADASLTRSSLLAHVPEAAQVPSYNFSVPYSWLMHSDDALYREADEYAELVDTYAPIAELAPWDPAYQNLFRRDMRYLSDRVSLAHLGRSDADGGSSASSYLLEVLSGVDLSAGKEFTGPTHVGMLSEEQLRLFMGVIDVGYPYMTACDDKVIPSGPNAGEPWGSPN